MANWFKFPKCGQIIEQSQIRELRPYIILLSSSSILKIAPLTHRGIRVITTTQIIGVAFISRFREKDVMPVTGAINNRHPFNHQRR